MQIKVAKHSGFCFGVKRAINIVEKALRKKIDIYSLGPIIHNPEVVNELSKKGLKVIRGIGSIDKGAVVISSHGAPIETVQKIKEKGLRLIDATCPFVKHSHDIVKTLKRDGYSIIIIGDKAHPEVRALLSSAGKKVYSRKIGIVSQTTQTKHNYIQGIVEALKGDFSEIRIFNTICNDTSARQTEARRLLKDCNVMVVVGGKNSANTRRLFEICKERGVDSHHIESDVELKKEYFRGKRCVGVVSGASTPDSMVNKVVKKIEMMS
jgi:4-hydroxy-3-methylbut-2-enyl diphosphate reductase